jgi:transposase InsO family protein
MRCYGRLTQALRRPLESAQYASEPYQAILARHGLRCSMSRRGELP